MKKIISPLMAAAVCALLFTGCLPSASKTAANKSTSSSYTSANTATNRNGAENRASEGSFKSSAPSSNIKQYRSEDTFPMSEEAIYESADAILCGKVIKTEIRYYDPNMESSPSYQTPPEPFTFSTIQVEECIKGGLKTGSTLRVVQWGNNKDYISREVMQTGGYLKTGDRLYLLLSRPEANEKYSLARYKEDGSYGACEDGEYWLDANGNITSSVNNTIAKGCKTLADLKKMTANMAAVAQKAEARSRMAAAASAGEKQ